MSLYIKLKPKIQFSQLILVNCRHLVTKPIKPTAAAVDEDDEYTKEPQYPPILDLESKAIRLRNRQEWHDKIKNVKTIEEKLIGINMPRYYGFKSVMLNDHIFRYNSLPFFQHITRTQLVDAGLPDCYNNLNEKVDGLLGQVKSDVEDAVLFEYTVKHEKKSFQKPLDPETENRNRTLRVVRQIHRTLMNSLAADCPHLLEVDSDTDPRHEAFWFVGGIDPPKRIRNLRLNSWDKANADDPVNRSFQYVGKPLLTLRHEYPLESLMEFDNFSAEDISKVPEYRLDPATVGYATKHKHATTIPGFWPGCRQEFGLLSYHSRDHIPLRNAQHGQEDCQKAIHSQAIVSSYAWLLGQACYQGFSTYQDPTYPLSTQTIITDGQLWSFYLYQLNTTRLHIDAIENNPKVNQCWGTKEMKLFEQITEDGKLIGLNDDVLRNLMKFYINEPKQRAIDMKPYLGLDEQKIADIEHVERREFLQEKFNQLFSGRPRHKVVPEVYNWEKIYKIDHKTMPLVPRRRFFELGINPFRRTLDEHRLAYVPKALRPDDKKNREKFKKTYYPCKYEQKYIGYVSTFNRKLI
ncbi:28S ribosomal protein S30, mitochondrial [Bradysia coprophila]|uniref:28S ribosomal protein S30, mitochondrial n=1 Tax=Bradysia coprophila TaxID=38358 RepID=UPI00187D8A3C|nr:28S ribosomal protein S30, mitochondrial [Bradysia coprophila]